MITRYKKCQKIYFFPSTNLIELTSYIASSKHENMKIQFPIRRIAKRIKNKQLTFLVNPLDFGKLFKKRAPIRNPAYTSNTTDNTCLITAAVKKRPY